MVLPIVLYGHPALRRLSTEIPEDYEGLGTFITDLFETMQKSEGIGLAAPQVGKSIRVFVIDASPLEEDEPTLKDFRKVFINPKIIEFIGEDQTYNEGCLSIPEIREDVVRPASVRVQYYDQDFKLYDEVFDGVRARIIQHEYDHLEGTLFTDKISPLRRRMLAGKLKAISKGKVGVHYMVKTA